MQLPCGKRIEFESIGYIPYLRVAKRAAAASNGEENNQGNSWVECDGKAVTSLPFTPYGDGMQFFLLITPRTLTRMVLLNPIRGMQMVLGTSLFQPLCLLLLV